VRINQIAYKRALSGEAVENGRFSQGWDGGARDSTELSAQDREKEENSGGTPHLALREGKAKPAKELSRRV